MLFRSSRSESCWGESSVSENDLEDCLSLSASMSGFPPEVIGAGSEISCASSITGEIISKTISNEDKLVNAFFMM